MPVPFPVAEEQRAISEFLGSVDEWIDNLREQMLALVSYRKGVMQKIFSKELRFKDKDVLIVSGINMPRIGNEFKKSNSSAAFIGKIDFINKNNALCGK